MSSIQHIFFPIFVISSYIFLSASFDFVELMSAICCLKYQLIGDSVAVYCFSLAFELERMLSVEFECLGNRIHMQHIHGSSSKSEFHIHWWAGEHSNYNSSAATFLNQKYAPASAISFIVHNILLQPSSDENIYYMYSAFVDAIYIYKEWICSININIIIIIIIINHNNVSQVTYLYHYMR